MKVYQLQKGPDQAQSRIHMIEVDKEEAKIIVEALEAHASQNKRRGSLKKLAKQFGEEMEVW